MLSLLVGPCLECGDGRLEPVFDGELSNFLCRNCGACWHPELEWVHFARGLGREERLADGAWRASYTDETPQRALYRAWVRLMEAGSP